VIPKGASFTRHRVGDGIRLVIERGIGRVSPEPLPQQAPLGGTEMLVEGLLQVRRQTASFGELVEDAGQNWGWVVDSDHVVEGKPRFEVNPRASAIWAHVTVLAPLR